MKEKINYQNWPERVKILTALSNKNLLIKNYKIPRTLGYFVLIMGIIDLIIEPIKFCVNWSCQPCKC